MKKRWSVFVLLCLLGFVNAAKAQNNSLELSKYISLTEKMTEQVFTIEVVGDVVQFSLRVNCDLQLGEVILEVFDPAGKPQGKFSVQASNSETYQSRGKLERNIDHPSTGTWLVKVVAKKAKGNVYIRSQQEFEK